MKAKVCDCIPGAGKTEAAITMMKRNPDKRYLFVTPYLDEVQRIKDSCSELSFEEPEDSGRYFTKMDSLHELLRERRNIAQSHALFSLYTEETRRLIRDGGYTLILDEVMNVINRERMSKADIQILFDAHIIEMEDDGYHIRWLRDEYNGTFRDLKKKADSHNLFLSDSKLLFWTLPVKNFGAFTDIYVLTYLFRAQIQKYYYEINGVEFEYIGVRNTENGYEFSADAEIPAYAKTLIDRVHIIDDEKANAVGAASSALSSDWFRLARGRVKNGVRGADIEHIKRSIRSLFGYHRNVSSSDFIWTTFKEQQNALDFERYRSRFVSCNIRATNAYRNCHYAAYCVNIFFNPDMSGYLKKCGVTMEEDMYALSEMIQWVWRSAVRAGEEVWIYIPSARMRHLLQDWLEALAAGRDVAEYHQEREQERALMEFPTPIKRNGKTSHVRTAAVKAKKSVHTGRK